MYNKVLFNQIRNYFNVPENHIKFAYDNNTYAEIGQYLIKLKSSLMKYSNDMVTKYGSSISDMLILPGYKKECLNQVFAILDKVMCRPYDDKMYVLVLSHNKYNSISKDVVQSVDFYEIIHLKEEDENMYGLHFYRDEKTDELSFKPYIKYSTKYYGLLNVLTDSFIDDITIKENDIPKHAEDFIKILIYIINKRTPNTVKYDVNSLEDYYDDNHVSIGFLSKSQKFIVNRLITGKDYFTYQFTYFIIAHIPTTVKQCYICKDVFDARAVKHDVCKLCQDTIEGKIRMKLWR